MNKKLLPQLGGKVCKDSSVCHYGSNKVPIFYGHENYDYAQYQANFPLKMEVVNETSLFSSLTKSKEGFTSVKNGIWSILEIAELVGGSLPLVHPEAILVNLLSGIYDLVDALSASPTPLNQIPKSSSSLMEDVLIRFSQTICCVLTN